MKKKIWLPLSEFLEKYGFRLFSPKQKIIIFWDFLMLGLIFWNFILLSISISFGIRLDNVFLFKQNNTLCFDCQTYYGIYMVLLTIILHLDILVTLNTSYYEAGELVVNRNKIAKNYFRNSFAIDLITLIPIYIQTATMLRQGQETEDNVAKLILLVFFLKYFQIKKLLATIEDLLTFNEVSEAVFGLIKITGKIIIVAHILACIWHIIGYYSAQDENWLKDINIYQASWQKRYLYSYYWALTTMATVGYGDVTAHNEFEIIFNIFTMVLGSAIFGYTINSIGYLLEKMNMKENQMKNDLRILERYMRRKNLDYDLQTRVKKYMEFIWNEEKSENLKKEDEILRKLSSQLRDEVLKKSNGRALDDCHVLSKNFSEKTLGMLTHCIRQIRFSPEEIIFNEGDFDEDQFLYILNKGEVQLMVDSFRREEKPVVLKYLQAGEVFGEASFFAEQPLQYTAKSINFSTLLIISKADFLNIIRDNEPDYETYCKIRDEIVLYKNLKSIHHKCYSCSYSSHQISDCPCMKINLNKDFILTRYQTRKRKRRNNFLQRYQRRDRQKTSALMSLKEVFLGSEKYKNNNVVHTQPGTDEEQHSPTQIHKNFKTPPQKPRLHRKNSKTMIIISGPSTNTTSFQEQSTNLNGLWTPNLDEGNSNNLNELLMQPLPKITEVPSSNSKKKFLDDSNQIDEALCESEIKSGKSQNTKMINELNETSFERKHKFDQKEQSDDSNKFKVNSQNTKQGDSDNEDNKASKISKNSIKNIQPSNALLTRRNSLRKIGDPLGISTLQVKTSKEHLADSEAIRVQNHLKSLVAFERSNSKNLQSATITPGKATAASQGSNTTAKSHKQTTAEQIYERFGVEILSPTSKVSWKKHGRPVSPMARAPFERNGGRRKTIEYANKKNTIKLEPAQQSNDRIQTQTSIPDVSARLGPKHSEKKESSSERKEGEEPIFTPKDEPEIEDRLLDMMDTNKNFIKYFPHNNPDAIFESINKKVIASVGKKKVMRSSMMWKSKQHYASPRKSIQLNKADAMMRKNGSKKNLFSFVTMQLGGITED